MKHFFLLATLAFSLLSPSLLPAQILWQFADTLGGVRRGSYLFGTATGMYVLTDESSENDPGSYPGKTHLLYLNKFGALQWKQKVALGTPESEEYGYIGEPQLSADGTLTYSKVQVWDDFSWSPFLEKFATDGSHIQLQMPEYQSQIDLDTQNNVYAVSYKNLPGGEENYTLRHFDTNFQLTGNWPFSAGKFKVLGNGEFYQYGYLHREPDGQAIFGARKVTLEGNVIWEKLHSTSPQLTTLDNAELSASTVDASGNIYMLLRVRYNDGQTDFILEKITADGVLSWQHKTTAYGSVGPNAILSRKLLADAAGNCYLIGTVGTNNNLHDAFVNKFSPGGSLLWGRHLGYNNPNNVRSMVTDATLVDNQLLLTGWYSWYYLQDTLWKANADLFALKINASTGSLEWKGSYLSAPTNNYWSYQGLALTARTDTVFITGAKYPSNGSSNSFALTVCFATNINVNATMLKWTPFVWTTGTDNPVAGGDKNLGVFPNPAGDKIALQMPDDPSTGQLSFFNSSGQLVLQKEMPGGKQEIDVADLPAGFYALQWQTNAGLWRGKMVKQ